jgi:polyisoprenoid-binding protein YceI
MKTIYTLFFVLCITNWVSAQDRFLTKSGQITFFSSSPVEDIKAENNQVLSIVDNSNGDMAISILMKSFQFDKALMQEHFNENYVESDKFPKATFKGKIQDFESFKNTEKITILGAITIHGVSKEITIEANSKTTKDIIALTGAFFIKLADFDIAIPAVVAKNIAKEIKVSFEFNHKPYKK